jgi:hypothetical protein
MSRQLVKCPKCGWVHFTVTSFAEASPFSELSEEDKARIQRCFRCGAPSDTFVAAKPDDCPTGATLQCVVLPENRRTNPPADPENWQHCIDELTGGFWIPREESEALRKQQMKDRAIWPPFFEDLARVCMCAKCLEADADFRTEVAALMATLTPAECRRAIEIVCEDRKIPDELNGLIETYRFEQRYDYLLDALTVRGVANSEGEAVAMQLATGRPVYYADRRYPGGLVKRSPNGRKHLVSADDGGKFHVIRELS